MREEKADRIRTQQVYSKEELEKKGWKIQSEFSDNGHFAKYQSWQKGKKVIFQDKKTGEITHIFLTLSSSQ
jgi:ribulose bisphosphate carboxylase small subunit